MKKLSTSQIKNFVNSLPFTQGLDLIANLRKRESPIAYKESEDYIVLVKDFDFTKFEKGGKTLQDKFLNMVQDCIGELGYQHKAYSAHGELQVPMSVWYCIKEKWEAFSTSEEFASYSIKPETPQKSEPTTITTSSLDLDFSLTDEFAINQNIEDVIDATVAKGYEHIKVRGEDQLEFIKKYSGYGGLGNKGMIKADVAKGLLTEYYTPEEIIDVVWELVRLHGYVPGNVMEPSAGTGRFLWDKSNYTSAMALEINKYSAFIAKTIKFHKSLPLSIDNKHFEQMFIKDNKSVKGDYFPYKESFDLVIGNPPYGNFTGYHANLGEKDYSRAQNLVDYFIFRGLDLLKKGGLLAYVIGVEPQNGGVPFLTKTNDACKLAIAEKAELIDAYRLPKGAIPRTDVVCDIVVFRKK